MLYIHFKAYACVFLLGKHLSPSLRNYLLFFFNMWKFIYSTFYLANIN